MSNDWTCLGIPRGTRAASSLRDSRHSTKVFLCLLIVYLVWGSSFVFTKIAVENLPPALFAGIRFVTAGVLLALIAEIFGHDRLPRRLIEWRHVTIAGFFMIFISNGLNTWSMQYLPSNETALLNGTSAFWIAGLGVFGRRGHPLTRSAVLGLVIGFIGAMLMLVPKGPIFSKGSLAQLGVLTACASWSLGTLYYRSITTALGSMMFMALQMLMGGLMLLIFALARGDSMHWPPNAPGPDLAVLPDFLEFRTRLHGVWLAHDEHHADDRQHLQLREPRHRCAFGVAGAA